MTRRSVPNFNREFLMPSREGRATGVSKAVQNYLDSLANAVDHENFERVDELTGTPTNDELSAKLNELLAILKNGPPG